VDLSRFVGSVHIARFAADESFIDFYVTAQLLNAALLHGKSDSVKHEPRRLLRDA
jgi:hypothetical protein